MTAVVQVLMKVSGSPEGIEAFRAKHLVLKDGEEELSFEAARPSPEELKGITTDVEAIHGEVRPVAFRTSTDGGKVRLTDDEVRRLHDRYGVLELENWRRMYWGTSGDAASTSIHASHIIEIVFFVPMSFPTEWFGHLVRTHPELKFTAEYDDCGPGLSATVKRTTRPPLNEVYELTDAVARSTAHPNSFFIPSAEERDAVDVGDHVKLIFEETGMGGERMWVVVEAVDPEGHLHGRLINFPVLLEDAEFGDPVHFERKHIIDIKPSDGPIP